MNPAPNTYRWPTSAPASTNRKTPWVILVRTPVKRYSPVEVSSSSTLITHVSTAASAVPTQQTVETKRKTLTIHDLGWTEEKAAQVRAQLSNFAQDWDDPSMDVYDEY